MPQSKTKTISDIDKELAKWRKIEQDRHADTLAQLRDAILPKLVRLGVATVQVTYSGYGDSGAIDFVDHFGADGKALDIGPAEPGLDAEIESVVEEFLPDGFEINEGGQGTTTIDVAKGCLSIKHQENVVETTDTTKEIPF